VKIALVGNVNNGFYALGRYLRDRGLDVSLLTCISSPQHFYPRSQAFKLDETEFCKYIEWGWDFREVRKALISRIRSDVLPFQKLCVDGLAPACLQLADVHIDAFIPAGYDLRTAPFRSKLGTLIQNRFSEPYTAMRAPSLQKSGIENSGNIIVNDIETKASLEKLKYKGISILQKTPAIYSPDLRNMKHWADRLYLREYVDKIRAENDIILIHSSRHFWRRKGNDKVIRATADAISKLRPLRVGLLMIEYGSDFFKSYNLVDQLGMKKNTHWLPLSNRREILYAVSVSDIFLGEFHLRTTSGFSTQEAMALGVPVVQNFDTNESSIFNADPFPAISASTESQISDAICMLATDSKTSKLLGAEGSSWHEKWVVEKSIETLTNVLMKN
jgi:glycosyltransferase involved in cell wall biosynthesis